MLQFLGQIIWVEIKIATIVKIDKIREVLIS